MAYEEIVKRLAEDGIIPNEKENRRKKTRFYVLGVVALLLLGAVAYCLWRVATPLQMKINVIEDTTCHIPALPFEEGTLRCEYADNASQTLKVGAGNPTVFLNEIPYKYKHTMVHVVFEAEGYQRIDTMVPVQKSLNLAVKRNNDLGVVFGRVIDFVTGQPVEGAMVQLQDLTATTDAFGNFRIEIPFEKQDKSQRVVVAKEGYQLWDEMYRPSPTEPWIVMLENANQ